MHCGCLIYREGAGLVQLGGLTPWNEARFSVRKRTTLPGAYTWLKHCRYFNMSRCSCYGLKLKNVYVNIFLLLHLHGSHCWYSQCYCCSSDPQLKLVCLPQAFSIQFALCSASVSCQVPLWRAWIAWLPNRALCFFLGYLPLVLPSLLILRQVCKKSRSDVDLCCTKCGQSVDQHRRHHWEPDWNAVSGPTPDSGF